MRATQLPLPMIYPDRVEWRFPGGWMLGKSVRDYNRYTREIVLRTQYSSLFYGAEWVA